jgi:anaerobic carbon-monoxide dehydrogenase iron sulfur subunit
VPPYIQRERVPIAKKRIFAIEENCMGCGLCEVWCVVAHSKSKDIIKAFKEESPRPLPRIKVQRLKPTSFGLQCRFCDEPLCVAACLSGAMHYNEEGLAEHDASKCVGCGTCILFCPFGAIQVDRKNKHIVAKCDLCVESGEPACVEHCPNRALYVEVTDEEDDEPKKEEK